MTDELVVYAYNVLFGDAILVDVPDDGQRRFILIDVGNVLGNQGGGGADEPLLAAVDDVIARTGGHVDLYVMTHEHLDHVQGLLHAKRNNRNLTIDNVWMTASADPDYYTQHPDAKKKKLALLETVAAFDARLGPSARPEGLMATFELNNPRKTDDCVEHIRQAGLHAPDYLCRGRDIVGKHPFKATGLRILAPEEDTSVYYGSPGPHLAPPGASPGGASPPGAAQAAAPRPPAGVDGGVFYELIERMNAGLNESLLAIDQAANNTSLVVELTWRGRRLLFVGDAEQASWRMMADKAGLQPVDLLKVGHHGSQNATPPAAILDQILPPARKDEAIAIVSTHPNAGELPEVYHGVPDPDTLGRIAARTSKLYRTTDVNPGEPLIVRLSAAS